MNTSNATTLAGRTILVAGGTGNVGRYLVGALLAHGAHVIVPSRTSQRLDALRNSIPRVPGERFFGVVGDLGDEGLTRQIQDILATRTGPLSAVIASLGRFQAASSVLDAPLAQLDAVLDDYLRAHWRAAQAFIPLLGANGSYTLVNGPLAFQAGMKGAGLVSIATAAQAMLAQVLMKETSPSRARINELVVYTPFGWGDEAAARAPVSQQQVADFVVRLVAPSGDGVNAQSIHLNDPSLEMPR